MNSSPLNEKECFLVIHSLDELYAFLRKSGSRDRSLSRSAVSQNLSAILSSQSETARTSRKCFRRFFGAGAQGPLLGRVRNAGCDSFSAYRNALASPVRGKAQESQQACDRLLRLFSDLLAEVGIEIESLFQGP